MPRIALGLAYDGSAWQGWQSQPDGRTVQDTLETALAKFLAEPTSTICAGRTDTGVHALEQVVHLDTQAIRQPESWVRGLNALLPESIAVQWSHEVDREFHARFSAQERTYIYIVRAARVRSPLTRERVGWVYRPMRLEPMLEAARLLLGKHDFSCFRSSQCQAASPVRTMLQADIRQQGEYFEFIFTANAFLHHMIRNIMGALVYIGQGRQPSGWIRDLLDQKDRKLAAPTFAPDGLYLARVRYPEHFSLPSPSLGELRYTHLVSPCAGYLKPA